MKKYISNTAFTLIELIVSLALVSVIVMGIISINLVLSNNSQDYGQKYLVKSQTQITLNHIMNNAALAVGDGVKDVNGNLDLGILAGGGVPPGVGNADSFCIHQSGTGNVPPGQNIINSATDIWLCYTWIPATFQIYWCTSAFSAAVPYRGAAAPCTAVSNNYTFLGSARNILLPTPPTFAATPAPTKLQFNITVTNCLNDAKATCGAGGVSTDPVNNPEVQVSGAVSMQQEGTG